MIGQGEEGGIIPLLLPRRGALRQRLLLGLYISCKKTA